MKEIHAEEIQEFHESVLALEDLNNLNKAKFAEGYHLFRTVLMRYDVSELDLLTNTTHSFRLRLDTPSGTFEVHASPGVSVGKYTVHSISTVPTWTPTVVALRNLLNLIQPHIISNRDML
jgi:hypothetical protein